MGCLLSEFVGECLGKSCRRAEFLLVVGDVDQDGKVVVGDWDVDTPEGEVFLRQHGRNRQASWS